MRQNSCRAMYCSIIIIVISNCTTLSTQYHCHCSHCTQYSALSTQYHCNCSSDTGHPEEGRVDPGSFVRPRNGNFGATNGQARGAHLGRPRGSPGPRARTNRVSAREVSAPKSGQCPAQTQDQRATLSLSKTCESAKTLAQRL